MIASTQYTVADAIEAVGFGKYQYNLVLLSSLLWMFDSIELVLTSILGPVLFCQWHLSAASLTIMSTGVFVGMSLGSPILGLLTDTYGRRKVIIPCLIFQFIYGILSSAAPTLIFLVIIRTIYGSFLALFYQVYNLMIEYTPTNNRVACSMILTVPWTLGSSMTSMLASLLIPSFGWRLWVLVCCFPCIIAFMVLPWYPESVMYLGATGQKDSVKKILAKMSEKNKRPLPQGELVLASSINKRKATALFSKKYRRTSILMMMISVAINVLFYGVLFLQPMLLQSNADSIKEDCHLICKKLTKNEYYILVYSSLSELIGLGIYSLIVNRIGRRDTISAGMTLCIFIMFSIMFSFDNKVVTAVAFCFSRCILCGMTSVLIMFTLELYPTKIRGLAIGLNGFSGKIGSVMAPFITQAVYLAYPKCTFLLLAIFSLIAVIGVRCLPETTNRSLDDTGESENEQE